MKQFQIFKNQHMYSFIILFIVFPFFLSIAIFAIAYSNTTRENLENHLDQDNANIYIYRKSGENFISHEIEFINQNDTNNISPLYFNEPESIDIETNDYTISSYKITNNSYTVFSKKYQNNAHSKNIYSAITYNNDNKPNQNEIIKSFPNNDGIYISQKFLANSNIKIDQINENSVIEFTVQIPLFSGTMKNELLYPQLTSFVYNAKVSKKISGIIKENKDLEKITDSQNLIMYPLDDFINLIKKNKDISIPANISNTYQLFSPIPNAYLISSSSNNIQNTYTNFINDSTQYFAKENINNHFDIYSQYYLNQTFLNKLLNFKSTVTIFSFVMLLITFIALIISIKKSFHFIKTETYIKNLFQQNLSNENIMKYIKWEYLFLIFSFIFISLISLIIINIFTKTIISHTDTNMLGIMIIEGVVYMYMWLILFIRYKKQLLYVNNYIKVEK